MDPDQEAKWQEEKKYCAARFVWSRRGQQTPSRRYTWERWWEKMFRDDYRDYTNKMINEREVLLKIAAEKRSSSPGGV